MAVCQGNNAGYCAMLAGVLLLAGCNMNSAPDSRKPLPAPGADSAAVICGETPFVEGYSEGLQEARQSGKPALVFFTAEWCDYCHQMADEAFADSQVVTLAGRFVCVLVDCDSEPEICRQFAVRGYPTIQFISPHGVPLNRLVGKQPAGRLALEMQTALEAVASHGGQTALR